MEILFIIIPNWNYPQCPRRGGDQINRSASVNWNATPQEDGTKPRYSHHSRVSETLPRVKSVGCALCWHAQEMLGKVSLQGQKADQQMPGVGGK